MNFFAKVAVLIIGVGILAGCACPGGRAILPSERIAQLEEQLAACEEKLSRCEASFANK